LRFSFRGGELPPFDGEMIAFDPPSLLEFRWGDDVIRVELEPDGSGTRLTLLDTLAERGKGARDAAGWHVCLANLSHHLDGEETRDTDWQSRFAGYVERFGPEASTIGPPEEFRSRSGR
jgi:hypothetical protein